jgi:hypothetical protein|tara:strand:- start:26 stop:877 length:852 start_codon:yes stop_codon:yes gene_type:complete
MTATTLGEISEERSGTYNGQFRTYVRKFRVQTTLVSESSYTAGSALGLPLIGDYHDEDSSAYCKDVSIAVNKARFQWIYTANYSSEFVLTTNPLLEPPRFTWSTEAYEKEVSAERDGSLIVNTAGDPIKGVTRDDSRIAVQVEKNVSSLPGSVVAIMDHLNSGAFTIDGFTASRNSAKFTSLGLGPVDTRNGVSFRVMKFIIQFREDLWKAFPANVGVRCKDSIDPQKRCLVINDGDLTPVTEPVPLDLYGNALYNPTQYNVLYRDVDRYPEASFSSLSSYLT